VKLSLLWKPKDSIFSWSVCSSTVICKLSYHGHSWVRALGWVAGIAAPLQQLFPGSALQTKPKQMPHSIHLPNSCSRDPRLKPNLTNAALKSSFKQNLHLLQLWNPVQNTVAKFLVPGGDVVDFGIGCRTGPPMQLGGPERQPYAGVDYIGQSRTKNLASGGHLSASENVQSIAYWGQPNLKTNICPYLGPLRR
jgi:hypothetical protein